MSVCLYPINVKTLNQAGPNLCYVHQKNSKTTLTEEPRTHDPYTFTKLHHFTQIVNNSIKFKGSVREK